MEEINIFCLYRESNHGRSALRPSLSRLIINDVQDPLEAASSVAEAVDYQQQSPNPTLEGSNVCTSVTS
jgi:hypothetical protein